jgi:hypothetical protein
MLEGKGRYWKTGKKVYIYIPYEVVMDSSFPLKGEKGDVKVKIVGETLIVERMQPLRGTESGSANP